MEDRWSIPLPAVSERRGGPRRALGNSDWMISFRKSSSGIDGFLGDGTSIPKGDVERALSSGEQSILHFDTYISSAGNPRLYVVGDRRSIDSLLQGVLIWVERQR